MEISRIKINKKIIEETWKGKDGSTEKLNLLFNIMKRHMDRERKKRRLFFYVRMSKKDYIKIFGKDGIENETK